MALIPKPGSPMFSAVLSTTKSHASTNCCPGVTLKTERNRAIDHSVGRGRRTLTMRVTFLWVSMVGFATAIKTGNPRPIQERGVRSDRNYFSFYAKRASRPDPRFFPLHVPYGPPRLFPSSGGKPTNYGTGHIGSRHRADHNRLRLDPNRIPWFIGRQIDGLPVFRIRRMHQMRMCRIDPLLASPKWVMFRHI